MVLVNLEILSNNRKYFYSEPIDHTLIPIPGDYLNINVVYYTQRASKLTEHKHTLINALVITRIFHIDSKQNKSIQLKVRE